MHLNQSEKKGRLTLWPLISFPTAIPVCFLASLLSNKSPPRTETMGLSPRSPLRRLVLYYAAQGRLCFFPSTIVRVFPPPLVVVTSKRDRISKNLFPSSALSPLGPGTPVHPNPSFCYTLLFLPRTPQDHKRHKCVLPVFPCNLFPSSPSAHKRLVFFQYKQKSADSSPGTQTPEIPPHKLSASPPPPPQYFVNSTRFDLTFWPFAMTAPPRGHSQ